MPLPLYAIDGMRTSRGAAGEEPPGKFKRRWRSARYFALTRLLSCLTLYDMKTSTITIRLDKDLDDLLTKASRMSGRNRSEIAREALRRQLRASQFETLRRRIMPFAEARGYLTDEDVFAAVS